MVHGVEFEVLLCHIWVAPNQVQLLKCTTVKNSKFRNVCCNKAIEFPPRVHRAEAMAFFFLSRHPQDQNNQLCLEVGFFQPDRKNISAALKAATWIQYFFFFAGIVFPWRRLLFSKVQSHATRLPSVQRQCTLSRPDKSWSIYSRKCISYLLSCSAESGLSMGGIWQNLSWLDTPG